jgi:taurine transport system permease protein
VLTVLVAVPVGLWMGMNESVKAVLDPPIEITRPMPKLALLPLLIIWFGIGEVAKVVIIVLALFPILSISAMQAVRGVGQRKIQAALALGASRSMIFRRVIFPASLPGIFTSIRVSIGLGVTMLVGAEMIATTAGIAFMAMSASDFLLTNVVIVGVLIMALLGYVLDLIARAVENRVVHWGGKEG